VAAASLAEAEAMRDVAKRNVEHLVVKAPASGVVLRLLTAPGGVAGPDGSPVSAPGEETGSTGQLGAMTGGLVSIYDPARLQARVDVQLGQVGGIVPDTKVEVEADALPGRKFAGVVDRVQREADILKNTLQVKVRLTEPDPLLRPEMLVRARFLAPERVEGTPEAKVAVLVPTESVRDDAVFVFDPTRGGRARRVPVKVVRRADAWTEVEGPLGPGHKVVLDPVADGESVRGAP
jgi:multidrug efflux pump subunit AcrA (membrane-fusion protein)